MTKLKRSVDPAMGEPSKRVTRMRYDQGPCGFLQGQVIKGMQQAGYPAKLFQLFRSPELQEQYFLRGTSKAPPWRGAHQHHGAFDIIHERWAWFDPSQDGVPDGEPFWECLWDVCQVVSEKFGVELGPRISWDPAHVELVGWRDFAKMKGNRVATPAQLDQWFEVMLPDVWRAYQRALRQKEEPSIRRVRRWRRR